ncbi:MAG TPA: ABC transporter permease [Methylomirabilota bacterium]|nr:ABC transporter permease [Methylomirabilota bacterium]
MRRSGLGRATDALSVLVYVFLLAPLVVVVLASFNAADYLSFPPRGFSLRWYRALWESEVWTDSFRLSLLVCAVVTPLALGIGTLAAYALGRYAFPGRRLVQTLVMAPLVMPQIVLGIALLNYFSALGLINTLTGLVLGHLVVALPYTVRLVSISVQNLDPVLERAAQNLGATPAQTFRRVTVPLLRPGLVAGAIFAAIISFGELAVTLLIAGARTTTLPMRIFNYTEYNFDPAINAVSTIFVVLALVLIVVLDRLIGLVRIG